MTIFETARHIRSPYLEGGAPRRRLVPIANDTSPGLSEIPSLMLGGRSSTTPVDADC
jgi:hypothetical protein